MENRTMIKRWMAALFIFWYWTPCFAQQLIQTNHSDLLIGNQGILLLEEGLTIAHRQQWFKASKGITNAKLNFNKLLSISESGNTFGIMIQLENDQHHSIKQLNGTIGLGYNFKWSDNWTVNSGISLGLKNQSLDFDGLAILDFSDELLMNSSQNKTVLTAGIGLGMFFQSSNKRHEFRFYGSTEQLNNEVFVSQKLKYKNEFHLNTQFRYSIKSSNSKVKFEIGTANKTLMPLKAHGMTLNLFTRLFLFDELLWLGGGYRWQESGIYGGLGLAPWSNRQLRISTTYEYHPYLGGSFEIAAQFRFDKRKKKVEQEEIKSLKADKPSKLPEQQGLAIPKVLAIDNEYLDKKISRISNIPDELITWVEANDELLTLHIEYPDELGQYNVNGKGLEKTWNLLNGISYLIQDIYSKSNLAKHNTPIIKVAEWLLENDQELKFDSDTPYKGELPKKGPLLIVPYKRDSQKETLVFSPGVISNEELAVLKIYSLGQELIEQINAREVGISKEHLQLEIKTSTNQHSQRKISIEVIFEK